MRFLFLTVFLLSNTVPSFAQEPDTTTGQVQLPVITRTDIQRVPLPIIQDVLKVRKFYMGMNVGYASAFAKIEEKGTGGDLKTLPGFEAGVSFRYHFGKYIWLSGGVNYVSRNFQLNAMESTFAQRNDRLCIPLLVSCRFFQNGPLWLRKTHAQLGGQIDLWRIQSPATRLDAATGVQNTITATGKPEVLLVGGLLHYLPPVWKMKGSHSVSALYSYGLTKTFHGEVGTPSQLAFRYSNAGAYLSVKYTCWFSTAFKKR
jgi:hypothetical protein